MGSYNCKVSKFENILYVEELCFSFLCGGKFSNLVIFSTENGGKKKHKKICAVKGIFLPFFKLKN
jgi:hypothetical protein